MNMPKTKLTRRRWLKTAAGAALATGVLPHWARGTENQEQLPPVRAITRGPKHHWFSYYDKLEFDPTRRHVLGMAVGFEGRSPGPGDAVAVGMVDLAEGDRWIELGESRAWWRISSP